MASTADSFILSPNICSLTDKDGTTILNVEQDVFYSIIGVGSSVWAKLATCQGGLTLDTIVQDLGTKFRDVPRRQIEHDVERFLASFQQKGLIQSHEKTSGLFVQAMRQWANNGLMFLARLTLGLLQRLRLNNLAAFFSLATINLMLKTLGFRALHSAVKNWPLSNKNATPETEDEICAAVDRATVWYPKQAMCLQRSAITTCLLRQQGVSAQMVIGCRKIPFKAHAWVEVDGRVVNDKKKVRELYSALDRC